MKAGESEVPEAHFTVDKQNISLWPREPPPKVGSSPVLRNPCTVRAAVVILTLVLLASILLQAIVSLYPFDPEPYEMPPTVSEMFPSPTREGVLTSSSAPAD